MFFLLYNATSFVTIARFRAEILPLGGGMVRKEMCQIKLSSQHKMHWKKHHMTTIFSQISRVSHGFYWHNTVIIRNDRSKE